MPKKSKTNEVHQPDDVLFKELMSIPKNVVGYMRALTPDFAETVDLSTLQLCSESFISPDLKTFTADVVWRCQLKKHEEEVYITFLCENKSEPDTYISIQVGLYLMLAYHKIVKEKGRRLEPIIPLIFYNGKQDWQPKTIEALFSKHVIFKDIEPYLPSFHFHFTNVSKVPREELMAIGESFLRSVLLAMANKHDIYWLEQNISVIFDFEDGHKHLLVPLSRYIFGIIERLPDEIRDNADNLKKEVKMKINSTLNLILEEGKEIGKAEGREIGKEIGKEIGISEGKINGGKFATLIKDLDTVLYFTTELPDIPLKNIISLTNRPEDFILNVQKEFQGGNERKARKFMKVLLKEFDPLDDAQKKTLEKLFDKHLPKLRKK